MCRMEFFRGGQCSSQGLSLEEVKRGLQFSPIDKYGKYTDSPEWLRKLPLGRWYLFIIRKNKFCFIITTNEGCFKNSIKVQILILYDSAFTFEFTNCVRKCVRICASISKHVYTWKKRQVSCILGYSKHPVATLLSSPPVSPTSQVCREEKNKRWVATITSYAGGALPLWQVPKGKL